jgi:NAD(P)-dependent dehydrogenase (short-subunit alcohol dehydrogenase family)
MAEVVTDPYSGLQLVELSHVWGHGVPSEPGQPDVRMVRAVKHAQHGVLAWRVTTSLHTGTHMNAPIHMAQRGDDLAAVAPDRLFSVNVRAVMMACKLFGAHMIEQGGGKIINLSSVRDDRGALGGNAGYCATKGAVKMITKQLGVELAPHKVCVNALGPIITVTPMTAERIKQDSARYERMLLNVPMGRMADVEDLVGPAVFLASSASDFITGTVLYVDGGMMAYA